MVLVIQTTAAQNLEVFRDFVKFIQEGYEETLNIAKRLRALKLDEQVNKALTARIKANNEIVRSEQLFVKLIDLNEKDIQIEEERARLQIRQLELEGVLLQQKLSLANTDRERLNIQTQVEGKLVEITAIEGKLSDLAHRRLIEQDSILKALESQSRILDSQETRLKTILEIYRSQAAILKEQTAVRPTGNLTRINKQLEVQRKITALAIQEQEIAIDKSDVLLAEIQQRIRLGKVKGKSLALEEQELMLLQERAKASNVLLNALKEERDILESQQDARVREIRDVRDPKFGETLRNEIIKNHEEFQAQMLTVTEAFTKRIFDTTDKFFETWITELAEGNRSIVGALIAAFKEAFNVFRSITIQFVTGYIQDAFRTLIRSSSLFAGLAPTTDLEKNTEQLLNVESELSDLKTNLSSLDTSVSDTDTALEQQKIATEALTMSNRSLMSSLDTLKTSVDEFSACACQAQGDPTREALKVSFPPQDMTRENINDIKINNDINVKDQIKSTDATTSSVEAVGRSIVRAVTRSKKGSGGFLNAVLSGIRFAQGSIETPGLQLGGIVKRPSFVQFAEKGPEAAVPLPDGKTIPVTISSPKGRNSNNNITIGVTVNVDSNDNITAGTSVTSGTSERDAERLGYNLSNAMKAQISEELRPGGLLYGRN